MQCTLHSQGHLLTQVPLPHFLYLLLMGQIQHVNERQDVHYMLENVS